MAERTLLFEETTKRIYTTDREDQVLQEFTDNTLSGKEAKKSRVKNKGVLSNSIAAHLFEYLEGYNIPTYYVETVNERQMLLKRV